VSHYGVGVPKGRASGSVILTLGHGVVPTVFWGNEDCQGPGDDSLTGRTPKALNLMGDWCGPGSPTTESTENRGASPKITDQAS
jgi:hypothetical protein